MSDDAELNDKIEKRKAMLIRVKEGLIERLNLQKKINQIDDDTPLFGNGLKLDSVDATEILVFLNDEFNIQVTEGDDPSYMRTINSLVTFILNKQEAQSCKS
ncbi:acyl carrier protein [Providencia burhodogranariea]|uniref:Acyl carrier protein n=1 Tax=Providencia burhodogranariea DSM 19968 TaxID=1141662 RepID=K8WX79_9GAMM|nr:phosphopantetheine-binding protein [Providencia burhodogranariea]EKT61987.1 acyl carrier protein [Providencia burhodogranariea DSM 19968]